MDFMSIFLSLSILRPPFAYFFLYISMSLCHRMYTVLPADFSVQERDQFVELSCDGGLKNEYKKDMLCDF